MAELVPAPTRKANQSVKAPPTQALTPVPSASPGSATWFRRLNLMRVPEALVSARPPPNPRVNPPRRSAFTGMYGFSFGSTGAEGEGFVKSRVSPSPSTAGAVGSEGFAEGAGSCARARTGFTSAARNAKAASPRFEGKEIRMVAWGAL